MKVSLSTHRLVDCLMTAIFISAGVNCILTHHYSWAAFFFAFFVNSLYLDFLGNKKILEELTIEKTEINY